MNLICSHGVHLIHWFVYKIICMYNWKIFWLGNYNTKKEEILIYPDTLFCLTHVVIQKLATQCAGLSVPEHILDSEKKLSNTCDA